MKIKLLGAVLTGALMLLAAPSANAVPINDLITNAIALTPTSGSIAGTTVDATLDGGAPNAGTSVTAPGVWYSFFGSGNTIILDTDNGTTNYDTKLSVYSNFTGLLTNLTGIAGNDDILCCTNLASQVSFGSVLGTQYYALVHGFSSATGNFALDYVRIGTAQAPEPATLALFGLGLTGMGLMRRRKRVTA